jgi:hypothetical protein
MSQDKEGWVYCISNENIRSAKSPNNVLLKIGMTERTPEERLAEANRSDTWRPPVNYKIEFAKKVKNAFQKEKTIHKLLEQYNERVNRSREFFDISVEKARLYFDLMDGEYLEPKEPENLKPAPIENLKPAPIENLKPAPIENLKPKKQKGGRKKKEEPKTDDNPTNISSTEINVEINNIIAQNIVDRFESLFNLNIKDLGEEESKHLLKVAFDKASLDIKVDKIYYTFDKLNKIKQVKNKIFQATISSPNHPIMYVTTKNIDSVINQIKYKTDSTFILLEEICKI